jgi:hypothetical protein
MRVQRAKQVAVMAGMVVVMTAAAAIPARAQSTTDSDVRAQAAKIQAETAREAAQMRVDAAKQAMEMAPLQAKLALQHVDVQAQMAKVKADVAKQMAEMAPLQAKLAAQMLPMQATMEMQMVPLRAEMMARSAAMQAQMMARSAVLQGEIAGSVEPQVKDDLFAGTEKFAKGASDVTDVNLDPSMMGMVGGKHGDLAHKLNFMVVRSYEYPEKGMYNMADVDAYRQKLKNGNWNCFVHTYESKTGESTDICNRALPNNQGNEMVIMTVEPKELTFIHMSGNASLADLGKMGSMSGHFVPERPEKPEAPEKPEQ